MFFCVTMMNWRGGAWLSFCIWCLRGRAATGDPSIFTQPTVSLPFRACVYVCRQQKSWIMKFLSTGNFQPQNVVKSLVPSRNTLVLFEVSPVSFHQVRIKRLIVLTPKRQCLRTWFVFVQVSEVLSQDKCRLSLSGWFHGPSLERPPRYIEPPVPRNPHLPIDVSLVVHTPCMRRGSICPFAHWCSISFLLRQDVYFLFVFFDFKFHY